MEAFIARQPVFDPNRRVYGYELLFRSGLDNWFTSSDPDRATAKVMADSFFLLDIESLTGGKRAFLNVTRKVLVLDMLLLLPKDRIVVEILENVVPDEEVIAACQRLKSAGYLLALDDFVWAEEFRPLTRLADIIKVDCLQTDRGYRRELAREFAPRGIRLLAEKVETQEMFACAGEDGYRYFQGYFFGKPQILAGRDIPGVKFHYLRVLEEIHRPEIDFGRLSEIIKREVSLSFKLLTYINSAFFGFKKKIASLKQALLLLGEDEVKKWVTLVTMAALGEDKPEELLINSILRARLCESLAGLSGLRPRSEDLFMLGLFSRLDALLDRPLDEILAGLPVACDIKEALTGGKNPLGEVYEMVLLWENGLWEDLSRAASGLGINEEELSGLYLQAAKWSEAFRRN